MRFDYTTQLQELPALKEAPQFSPIVLQGQYWAFASHHHLFLEGSSLDAAVRFAFLRFCLAQQFVSSWSFLLQ